MRQAIIVLPAGMSGSIRDSNQRRWLSRGTLHRRELPGDLFARVLSAAGLSVPGEGLAALRLWGQTGDRPTGWIAAADPTNLEARLDHLRLHALSGAQSPEPDTRAIFDHLQKSLGGNSDFSFANIGDHAYLRGDKAISTAAVSPQAIDGLEPDEFMPSGSAAAGYLKLTSELQMCLHEHEVNLRREAEGLMPVNSIWLWGGGMAPEKKVASLPPLFGVEPLLQGYWESCTGVTESWPGNFAECLEVAVKDLVVVTPAETGDGDAIAQYLDELRWLLSKGRLDRLVLLFRDGLSARYARFDAFRHWRRVSPLL